MNRWPGSTPPPARAWRSIVMMRRQRNDDPIVLPQGELGLDRELHISAGHVLWPLPEDDHEQHHGGGGHCHPTEATAPHRATSVSQRWTGETHD